MRPRSGTRALLRLLPALLVLAAGTGCRRKVNTPPIDLTSTPEPRLAELAKEDSSFRPQSGKYRIGPGDLVSMVLIGHEETLGEAHNKDGGGFLISDDPSVALPLIGAVRVHGRTTEELESDLKAAYAEYIRDPKPSVIVRRYQNYQVAILGMVNQPGKFPLEPGDTLLDVIFKAAGLTIARGNAPSPSSRLKLYREKAERPRDETRSLEEELERIKRGEETLQREEYTIPIEDYLRSGILENNVFMQPNDVVYIPSAGAANVISQGGGVWNPGVAYLGPSIRTVAEVINVRGGLRYRADSDIEVIRRDEDGQTRVFPMNVRRILKRTAPDFVLQDNDQLYVYNNNFRYFLEVLGSIFVRSTRVGVEATESTQTGGL